MNNRTILIFSLALLAFAGLWAGPCFCFDLETYDDLFDVAPEKKISMDFTNAKLNDVLKIFSQQSGLNFIAATDVASKTINLYLDQVPVEEALERILSANNLTYEIDPGSNIFVVSQMKTSPKQLMTRVYPLKFATVPSSKLNTTLSFEDSGGPADSESGIIGAISAVLTEDGSVVQDQRTNSIIVSDIPSQFPLIEQTVARLDVRIPQILIEAEMLDISKSTADLLGAKFGDSPVSFTGAERDTLLPFDRNKAMQNYGKTGGQGFIFEEPEYRVGTLSFQGLSVTLQFLRTQNDTRNLARPRILTLNNDTAEISITTNEAIGLSANTTSSEGTSTSVAEAERVETGVFLKVTPQANIHTREITMAIEPRVVQAKVGGTFGGQTFKDPEARGSKSTLRVRDGDTIVIGGLLRTNVDDLKTQVPFLGQIPVLGAAFRHKDKAESQRELIIFITPHIITEDTATTASSITSSMREQSAPADKTREIEKDLSYIEEQKFDSYR
ncbi:MAG TPA: secretin N-terminal domain-containing protein [Candidatus Omnitrophota bacterium]|nr:secretin N-terminal domain-containing protein [Candidatus Omnitrophota bacterium]